jgi:hypothetical protein
MRISAYEWRFNFVLGLNAVESYLDKRWIPITHTLLQRFYLKSNSKHGLGARGQRALHLQSAQTTLYFILVFRAFHQSSANAAVVHSRKTVILEVFVNSTIIPRIRKNRMLQ